MKNKVLHVVSSAVIVLSFFITAPHVFAAGTNLVQNSDFETVGSPATVPQGWATDSWGTLAATFTYPVAGNPSKAAQVKITSFSSGDAKWYFTPIPVTAGKTYTFSDSYSATVATNVTAEFLLSNGSYSYLWLGDPAATGSAWGTFSGQVVAPTSAVSMTILHVLEKVGTLTIDNVSVSLPGATPPAPTCTLGANPSSIALGSSTVLSLTSQNASTASINNSIGAVATTSTQSVSPATTTVYIATVAGTGTSTCSAQVTVSQPLPPPPPPPVVIPKPIITSFTATPKSILTGSSTVLSWVVTGASSTSIDQGIGIVTGGSKTVAPTATTTYTLTATNPGGSVSTTTAVQVVIPPPPPPPPPATTTPTNLIANGNLEAGSTAPTGWNKDNWGSLRATYTYPVAGKNGGKAAKATVTNWSSGDAKWWFNHIPVSSNTVYQFTDDYSATVITNVSIEFKMSNGTYQYQWLANAPATGTGWSTVSAQVTVPVGAVSMTILHALTSNGSLTIDNVSLTALPQNPFAQGMVTIVFDDGLASQYTNARNIINTAGIKAMFAVITQAVKDISGDNAAMTWAQITQLKNDGHEIGGHSRTHPDLSLLTTAQAQTEIKGSYDDLVAKGFTPKMFVYPLGGVSPAVETLVKNAGYIGARGSYWGLNTPTADKYSLYDMRLDKTTTLAQAKAWIDQAYADKRWLILELHDVVGSGGDDYAITTSFFQSVVTYIKQKGIKTVTLQEGLQYMQ